MSTKISKTKFTEMIRSLIKREIAEASTTATAGGEYDTPNAFQSKGKEKRKKIAQQGPDFKIVEAKFAVEFELGGSPAAGGANAVIVVDASGASQAKSLVSKQLKRGLKSIIGVKRVQPAFGKQMDKKLESVNEGRYHECRNDDSMTPKQKIGRAMREVRKSLGDLNKMVEMCVRLKNETKVDTRTYWKSTNRALTKISERLVKIANKVGKLQ